MKHFIPLEVRFEAQEKQLQETEFQKNFARDQLTKYTQQKARYDRSYWGQRKVLATTIAELENKHTEVFTTPIDETMKLMKAKALEVERAKLIRQVEKLDLRYLYHDRGALITGAIILLVLGLSAAPSLLFGSIALAIHAIDPQCYHHLPKALE